MIFSMLFGTEMERNYGENCSVSQKTKQNGTFSFDLNLSTSYTSDISCNNISEFSQQNLSIIGLLFTEILLIN